MASTSTTAAAMASGGGDKSTEKIAPTASTASTTISSTSLSDYPVLAALHKALEADPTVYAEMLHHVCTQCHPHPPVAPYPVHTCHSDEVAYIPATPDDSPFVLVEHKLGLAFEGIPVIFKDALRCMHAARAVYLANSGAAYPQQTPGVLPSQPDVGKEIVEQLHAASRALLLIKGSRHSSINMR